MDETTGHENFLRRNSNRKNLQWLAAGFTLLVVYISVITVTTTHEIPKLTIQSHAIQYNLTNLMAQFTTHQNTYGNGTEIIHS